MAAKGVLAVVVMTAAVSSLATMFMLSIAFGSPIKVFNIDRYRSVDTDHDGLPDSYEERIGTNIYSSDTDLDMLSDRDEVLIYHTDPLLRDTDGDGLSDYSEVKIYGTNPLSGDSDGDGLLDGEELQLGSDPLKRDTDGDGVIDSGDIDPTHDLVLYVTITLWKELVKADKDSYGDPIVEVVVYPYRGGYIDYNRSRGEYWLGEDVPYYKGNATITINIPDNIREYIITIQVIDKDPAIEKPDQYMINDYSTELQIYYKVGETITRHTIGSTKGVSGEIELVIHTS